MRPKAVTDLKNSLYYPLAYNLYTETRINSLIKLFLSDQTQESALATPIFYRQKQSFAYVLQMGDLKKFHNIQRKAPVLESLSNNVAG